VTRFPAACPTPAWLPARGTIIARDVMVTTSCGQYDLASASAPQAVPGQAQPSDWEQVTRAVPSGKLSLLVSCRPSSSPVGELPGQWRLVVRLATWSTWPGRFGHQNTPDGPGSQLEWGPELTSRLATTGSCAVDVSDWAVGARFVAVALTVWPLQPKAPSVAFDWQLIDGRPAGWCPTDVWPTAVRSEELSQTPLPPAGGLPAAARVGQTGMVRGWRPRLAVATNEHSGPVSVAAAARYGAARQRIADIASIQPGESRIVARLAELDPATGLEVFASAAGPGAHLTLDFA
jgi:hypothetical protein